MVVCGGAVLAGVVPADAREPGSFQVAANFADMSIEELANIEITSVSKKAQPLNRSAAAIYVITRKDIHRSGAQTLPEILRLAPNLQVARIDAGRYAITARGFGLDGSNKLLVMIDGRSVYSPLHAAVFWDAQDVLPENIDRIEVISGPGGTLWGTNAVNGIINIITRDAADTQGGFASVGTGTQERHISAQYGGRVGDSVAYRIYAKAFDTFDTNGVDGRDLQDGWSSAQGGFRLDWSGQASVITLHGDLYRNTVSANDSSFDGENLLMRWQHGLASGSDLTVQAYYDRTSRRYTGFIADETRTYDLEVRHGFDWAWNAVVWGGGYRLADGQFTNTDTIQVLPPSKQIRWWNLFVSDTIDFAEDFSLTAGIKYEHSSYSGGEWLPSARLSWAVAEDVMLWGAVSRAVRTPARIDRDLNQTQGGIDVLVSGAFEPEKLMAYELGLRTTPTSSLTFSVSAFYHDYQDLRTLESSATLTGLPYMIGNMMEGETYGVEVWGSYDVTDWWRLKAGFVFLEKDLKLKPDSTDTLAGVPAAGNDPETTASLGSRMDFGDAVALDLDFRAVGSRPSPRAPDYVELDARLGWRVSDHLELAVSGRNLLHGEHVEWDASPGGGVVDRAVYVQLLWRN